MHCVMLTSYLYSNDVLLCLYQYTIAMMGYGPEDKSAVLELTYNYGVTEYDKGNGYAQVNSKPFLKHDFQYFCDMQKSCQLTNIFMRNLFGSSLGLLNSA